MSDLSPIKPLSTSTPTSKTPRSMYSVIQDCTSEKIEQEKSENYSINESINELNDRSRSLQKLNLENEEETVAYVGRTDQSMRERLIRKEHQRQRVNKPVRCFQIYSSGDEEESKENDELMTTVNSFAAISLSPKTNITKNVEKKLNRVQIDSSFQKMNESLVFGHDYLNSPKNVEKLLNNVDESSSFQEVNKSVILLSPPPVNANLKRVLLDTSSSSRSNYLSVDENDSDLDENSLIQINQDVIPESPPRAKTLKKLYTSSSFIVSPEANKNKPRNVYLDSSSSITNSTKNNHEDQNESGTAEDSSIVLKSDDECSEPSIIPLSPIASSSKAPINAPKSQFFMFPPIKPHVPSQSKCLKAPLPIKRPGPPIISPKPFNTQMYENVLNNEKDKRLFGGKMTVNRMGKINAITTDALSALHTAISTAPDDSIRAETPEGLRVTLLPHQQHGLAWMVWRERQYPPSGILADDMGLGKTIAVISLILQKRNDRLKKIFNEDDEKIRKKVIHGKNLLLSNASLIVAPASVIMQWDKEIKDRVGSRLRHIVCHGQNRERYAANLARYDIVLTTYGTLTSELNTVDNSKSPFCRIAWERVILDEAHKIKNRTSQISKVVCLIPSVYRWCLTGTPIHNELWDLFSLIRFMKISPFNEESHWKTYIMSGTKNSERLNTLIKSILLRRTKTQVDSITNKRIIDLPDRKYTVVELKMEGVENHCYQLMFQVSRQKAQQFIRNADGVISKSSRASKQKFKNPFLFGQREVAADDRFQAMNFLLVLLLRLRQACVHLSLTRQAIDLDAFKFDGGEDIEKEVIDELERTFTNLNISVEDANQAHNREVEAVFKQDYLTAKIRSILSHLDQIIEKREKCVIVSQWTSVLSLLEIHLKQRRIRYTSVTGQILPKNRQLRIDDFNRKNGGAEVMLLSLTAGGVGLNLTGGNHLFVVDLHWNPAIENQACDRIYRVGQTKNVFIHKFIVEDTIEQRVMDLQQKKTALATSVLQGAASKNLTKLTVNDLKFLFELDKKPRISPDNEELNTITQSGQAGLL